MTIGLYKITNTVNGKYYIGSSRNIVKRWNSHKNKLRRNEHKNLYLQASYNKYGFNVFTFEILEEFTAEVTREFLISKEQELFDAISDEEWRENVYNMKKVANNTETTDEIRLRISQGVRAKWLDPQFREHMKQFSRKGQKMSEESKKKMSESRKGVKKSPESIEKRSATRRGKKASEEMVKNFTNSMHIKMSGKGVHTRRSGKFYAEIYNNKERIYLGQYETYEEALEARLAAEQKYWWSIEDGSDITVASGT
jgi:group I intron endonuclease